MSEDKLKFWDERAHLSDLAGSNDFGIKNFEMSTIEKFIEDGMKVLDLGCGSGTSAFHFARNKDIDITGLDFSSKMIDQANFDMKDRGFDSNKMRFFLSLSHLIPLISQLDLLVMLPQLLHWSSGEQMLL